MFVSENDRNVRNQNRWNVFLTPVIHFRVTLSSFFFSGKTLRRVTSLFLLSLLFCSYLVEAPQKSFSRSFYHTFQYVHAPIQIANVELSIHRIVVFLIAIRVLNIRHRKREIETVIRKRENTWWKKKLMWMNASEFWFVYMFL